MAALLAATLGGKGKGVKPKPKSSPKPKIPCPLCGYRLKEAERLHTIVYEGGAQRLVHIWGCPNCHPAAGRRIPGSSRICPACRRELPADGYIIGKMWREGARTKVRVFGCTRCKPQARNVRGKS